MEKMTLASYYNSLQKPTFPKTSFVRKVAERCGVGIETVRGWIRGDAKPSDERYLQILSEESGIPVEHLF